MYCMYKAHLTHFAMIGKWYDKKKYFSNDLGWADLDEIPNNF